MHTPGPWEVITQIVEDGFWEYSIAGDKQVVFETVVLSSERHHADASLIAAAPELLDACRSALADHLEHALPDQVLVDQLEDAIEKATGET